MRQNLVLFEQAKRDGYNEDEILIIDYKESGVNLTYQQRQGMLELEQAIEDYPIEIVYAHEISRVSRRQDVTFTLIQKLTDNGICLHIQTPQVIRTLNPDGTENAIANLVLTFLAYFAAEEARQFKMRAKTGVAAARAKGQIVTGKVFYGYAIDECKHPVIEPKQAEFVKRMFEDYANTDMSTTDIYRKYNDLGAFPNGSGIIEHGRSFICRMFRNRVYCGEMENPKYPAIVSKEIMDKVMAKVDDKAKKHVGKKSTVIYYCRGLLKTPDGYTLMPKLKGGCYMWTPNSNRKGEKQYIISNNACDTIAKHEALNIYSVFSASKAQTDKEWTLARIAQIEADTDGYNGQIKRVEKAFSKTIDLYKKGMVEMDDVEEAKKTSERTRELLTAKIDAANLEKANLTAALANEQTFIDTAKGVFDHNDPQAIHDIVHQMVDHINVERVGTGKYYLDVYPKITANYEADGVIIETDKTPVRYYYDGCVKKARK